MNKTAFLKEYRLNIFARILLLVITTWMAALGYLQSQSYLILSIIGFLLVIQVHYLIRYVDKTNRDVAHFIRSVKYSDFSTVFNNDARGGSYKYLSDSLAEVIEGFKLARAEKEENNRYLQTVIQHIGIGLISYCSSGKVEFINNAAKKILQVPHLKDITALKHKNLAMANELFSIKAGEKKIVKAVVNNELLQIFIYATGFKMRNENFTLIALQNIQSEMEEQEMEAWQKLIRVLTHEIMNSITPISSLAGTMQNMLEASNNGTIPNKETLEDFHLAVDSIKNRSEGLIHFVENYRSLVKIPKPDFSIIPVSDLFSRTVKLMESKLATAGIQLETQITPSSLEVTADSVLIEQVLINLLLNSIHALAQTILPKIALQAQIDERGRTTIQVKDNGEGIDELAIEKIFIPFFSTKKEGSGIGLSLSRQIMRSHGGNIRVQSVPGKETTFTLRF